MIYVDRASVPPVNVETDLFSAESRDARIEAFNALNRVEQGVARELWKTKQGAVDRLALEVAGALDDLFFGKCAYCDQRIATRTIHRHRPASDATGRDGRINPTWYGWLSANWENLYPACSACSARKGNRFPVSAGTRAEAGATGDVLRSERPLLLDPCDPQDNPETHLLYENGRVVGQTERGRVTVEVLDLNRPDLVARRKAVEDEFALVPLLDTADLGDLIDARHEFSGLRRQLVARALSDAPATLQETVAREQPAAVLALFNAREVPSDWRLRQTAREQRQFARAAADYSVAGDDTADGYYLRTVAVERVELTSVRAFRDASITFPTGAADRAPWLVLLGENGTGKSTILQAVALALAGDAYRARLGVVPDDLLRSGTTIGRIRVTLTGIPEPVTLDFRRGDAEFTSSHAEPKILFLGYGATRLLPRRDIAPDDGAQASFARAGNLFDPFVALADAQAWLADADDATFASVGDALRAVLDLADDQTVARDHTQVVIEAGGHRTPLRHLSTGYQAVLALVIDPLPGGLTRWPTPASAEGLVLLDEIGAHLHPRWQMRIVGALRDVLPRVQFLATTHSPLCLRGLRHGEVVVLRRADDSVRLDADVPPVDGLRVDQLLTSEHFGLHSTLDPAIEARFQWYYQLLASRDRTPEQDAELAALKADLDARRQFGTTRRERIALEAADATLAATEAETADPPVLSARVRDRIRQAWTQS